MRLLSITALGAGLVAAGLAAPAAGQATASAPQRVAVSPKTAQPGERLELRVPDCQAGAERLWATSKAFTADVELQLKAGFGVGAANVRPNVAPGSYTITAHCGPRTVAGKVKVAGKRSWPGLLPSPLNPQAGHSAP